MKTKEEKKVPKMKKEKNFSDKKINKPKRGREDKF